jgi:dTDP-4-dehydrorhamnose reductase
MAEATVRSWSCEPLSRERVWGSSMVELANLISGYDIVVHAAANTDVEGCEADPDSCHRDNYLLTEILCSAAGVARVPFVFISSTGIYGDTKIEPYREFDPVHPSTHHHRSKLLAEQCVLNRGMSNLVVRTGWLFGGKRSNRKNFIARRIEDGLAAKEAGKSLLANAEQRGVPCWTVDVARRILLLLEDKRAGVFNCVNGGSASRYEYVKAILQFARVGVLVEAAPATSFNRRAAVSANEMAVNWKMDALEYPPLPNWEESLSEYISSL